MNTTTTTRQTYSSAEVCTLAEVSYRQLDYWCRLGVTKPSAADAHGSGSRRAFTRQDVLVVAVLALCGAYVRVSLLDELAALLHDWDEGEWDSTTLLVGPGGVWLADEDGAPPVATAVNLGAIKRLVSERAAGLAL